MKSKYIFLLFTVMVLLAIPDSVKADEWKGNINFLSGARVLSYSDWKTLAVEEQVLYGVDFDFTKESWPVSLLIGISGSTASSNLYLISYYGYTLATFDNETTTREFDVGARKYFNTDSNFMPYISAGIASIDVENTVTCTSGCFGSFSLSDSSAGVFLDGGLMWRLGWHFNLGLDLKVLTGTSIQYVSNGVPFDIDADYRQAALILGYGF